MLKAQGTIAKPKTKRSTPGRSGEAIQVSARNGQSYADILKEMKAKVSTRSLEIGDLAETVEKEEVVSALCLALVRLALDGSCRLFTRFSRMEAAVIRLAEADAARLLQLGKVRIGWVECRIREHVEVDRCFTCLGYGHGSRGCNNPDREDACWRCSTTGHLARNC